MYYLQVMILYSIENSSRREFVSEMRSAKLANDIRQAASDAEASGNRLVF